MVESEDDRGRPGHAVLPVERPPAAAEPLRLLGDLPAFSPSSGWSAVLELTRHEEAPAPSPRPLSPPRRPDPSPSSTPTRLAEHASDWVTVVAPTTTPTPWVPAAPALPRRREPSPAPSAAECISATYEASSPWRVGKRHDHHPGHQPLPPGPAADRRAVPGLGIPRRPISSRPPRAARSRRSGRAARPTSHRASRIDRLVRPDHRRGHRLDAWGTGPERHWSETSFRLCPHASRWMRCAHPQAPDNVCGQHRSAAQRAMSKHPLLTAETNPALGRVSFGLA